MEFTVARVIASVSLFADSIDFLEDTAVNLLIALALGWSVASRVQVGMALAALLLVPGLATLWDGKATGRRLVTVILAGLRPCA